MYYREREGQTDLHRGGKTEVKRRKVRAEREIKDNKMISVYCI